MTFKAFHQACKERSWKKLGVCETALRRLKSSSKTEKYLRQHDGKLIKVR